MSENDSLESALIQAIESLSQKTIPYMLIGGLALLKLPSSRSKDREDVRLILESYCRQLVWAYLLPIADSLAETLDQPDLASILRNAQP